MKRKICELLVIFFFYLMQVCVARVIAIADISPNWLIILPVFFGFFCGKNEGMFVGFFSGLMYDLFFSGLFGFTALIYIYIGYFSGFFYQKYEVREILIPLALVLAAEFGYGFISYIGNFLLHNRLNVGFFVSRFILPEVVYTALVSLVIYHLIHYICILTDPGRERKKKGKINEGSI